MDELLPVYTTSGIILLYLLIQVLKRTFDPFAPVWLFLVGYVQIYVIQALAYHDWAVDVRGKELVTAANLRALWALVWFLAVYHMGIGVRIAPVLPQPPRGWSPALVAVICPFLIIWGLYCAGAVIRSGAQDLDVMSPEQSLFRSFPFVMMVAAILLIITARFTGSQQSIFLLAGLLVSFAYVAIWMFNGKRSHSLIGVLATVCAFYISRRRRPSWPVLFATSFTGALVVAIAIGWRNNPGYESSMVGFIQYLSEFRVERILESLNMAEGEADLPYKSYETEEYGGFLLMVDTVPEKAGYDYGVNYLRTFSTMIPRIVWPGKPLFGRAQWIAAWMAGSELERDEDFTSPAIGILGATQLNGGAIGTLIVFGCLAVMLRGAYEYFRLYAHVPWVQFWWAIIFYNSWFMVVCDDPMVWFYYNWGFSTFPIAVFLWFATKLITPKAEECRGDELEHHGSVHGQLIAGL
jgi:hypothetical protein